MKTIIAGGREFRDFDRAFKLLDNHHKESPITLVLCGMALHWLWESDPLIGGADRAGYEWAEKRGVPIAPYPADWRLHGKDAGYVRNVEMGAEAQGAVVFWDGKSKGSKNMIKIMNSLGKPVKIIPY